MKIIMVDWEIERDESLQKMFKVSNFRFQLQEVVEETATRRTLSVILNTNNLDELKIKLGELRILHPGCLNLEVEINKTLEHYRNEIKKKR
jgi:hypothetical protein